MDGPFTNLSKTSFNMFELTVTLPPYSAEAPPLFRVEQIKRAVQKNGSETQQSLNKMKGLMNNYEKQAHPITSTATRSVNMENWVAQSRYYNVEETYSDA